MHGTNGRNNPGSFLGPSLSSEEQAGMSREADTSDRPALSLLTAELSWGRPCAGKATSHAGAVQSGPGFGREGWGRQPDSATMALRTFVKEASYSSCKYGFAAFFKHIYFPLFPGQNRTAICTFIFTSKPASRAVLPTKKSHRGDSLCVMAP